MTRTAKPNRAVDDITAQQLERELAQTGEAARPTRIARAVSNGDTPPCWALVCPNPECGDIDTLAATFISVDARRGRPHLTIEWLTCSTCQERCLPPTTLEH